MFPEMQMKIREDAHLFLRQMKAVIDETGGFETRLVLEPPSQSHCSSVGFSPNLQQTHEGLVGIFVNWAHDYPLLNLQIIANRWVPEYPTYEVVKTAAQSMFLPVISAYNRQYRTRYRMRIESYEDTLPRLTPKAQEALNQFAHLANKRALHTLDWQRFYYFVRVCYATRNDLYESDISYFLQKAGFTSQYAAHITEIFPHLRDFHINSDWRRASNYRRRRFLCRNLKDSSGDSPIEKNSAASPQAR